MPHNLRHELKYLINYNDYLTLRNRLLKVLQKDPYAGKDGGYHIRSLYFDDAFDTALYEKDGGVFRRDKYRIRIYNKQDRQIKLERKSKFGQYTAKTAAALTRSQYESILRQDYAFLLQAANSLLNDFYFECVNHLLRPKVIVDYDREPFIYKPSEVRVTFDKMVRAGINTHDIFDPYVVTINAFNQPVMILEVKYNEFLPENVRAALQLDNHHRMAFSKYVVCRMIKNNI